VTAVVPEQTPVVSVIIPVYVSQFLREAVDSVQGQTFRDYEIIVVDDGSPEPLDLGRWSGVDQVRLRSLRQENRGPAAARNTAIRAAQGEFLAFLDADDSWEPTYLAEQIAAMTRDGGLDAIYCGALMMGQPEADRQTLMESAPARDLVTCASLLREGYTVFLSGVVARRQTVLDAGLFDERFVHGEDFDLWLRMLKAGARMGFQRRVLLNRRLHAASLSYDALNHSEKGLLVLEKFRARQDLTAVERAAVDWRIRSFHAEVGLERAKRALAGGDFKAAIQGFRDANEFYRSWKLRLVRVLLRLWPTVIARAHRMRERHRLARSPAPLEGE
jgi:glycosyltransferase involved in cell wall biosynthesis